ncbi:MAG: aldo/keto reductase, partial [Gemmatimonadales bacterium]
MTETDLERRKIGSLEVPVVGVGCNNFGSRIDDARAGGIVTAALDDGINFFDTADAYGNGRSEELLGQFIGGRRSEAIIATKFGLEVPGQGSGSRPEYVRLALDASLRRLRTDYIDLYQQHTPDPDVPIAETLGALDELVKA